VTVSSLSGLTYDSSLTPGLDRIWVSAEADGAWGNWTYVDMNNTGAPPPVTSPLVAQEQTIGPNQTVALSSLFSASESDGDPITAYQITEGPGNATPDGSITDSNGNTLAAVGQVVTVSSLSGLTYDSSSTPGLNRIWVSAESDGVWGNWTYVDMNNTGESPPAVSLRVPQEQTVRGLATVGLSSLFTASTIDGSPITAYQIIEGPGNSTPAGSISESNATTLSAVGQIATVSSLSGLTYQASNTPGVDRICQRRGRRAVERLDLCRHERFRRAAAHDVAARPTGADDRPQSDGGAVEPVHRHRIRWRPDHRLPDHRRAWEYDAGRQRH